MSVLVSVVGGNPDSDEYRAALKLKNIIQERTIIFLLMRCRLVKALKKR